MKHTGTILVAFILLSVLLQSCLSNNEEYVCTEEFAVISITVLDPNGEPADSVQISVVNEANGTPYDVCEEFDCTEYNMSGSYVIMHDGFLGDLDDTREDVIVEGGKDSLYFREEYAFRSGRCHVEKVAGPDTVFLIPGQERITNKF